MITAMCTYYDSRYGIYDINSAVSAPDNIQANVVSDYIDVHSTCAVTYIRKYTVCLYFIIILIELKRLYTHTNKRGKKRPCICMHSTVSSWPIMSCAHTWIELLFISYIYTYNYIICSIASN